MRRLEALRGLRVYLDSSALIYAVETDAAALPPAVRGLLQEVDAGRIWAHGALVCAVKGCHGGQKELCKPYRCAVGRAARCASGPAQSPLGLSRSHPMPRILLTGAAGYIASHTWLSLLEAGFDVVGLDNFSNSSPRVLPRIEALAGRPLTFEQADVCDAAALAGVFARHALDAVVHFAAFKAVGESVAQPLRYWHNNVGGTLGVCAAMQQAGVRRIVFSSTATVYGEPRTSPIPETAPLGTEHPYGSTKLASEMLLREVGVSDPAWQTAALRYFNPVGAHESGRIGEDPRGVPNNLMPYVAQVAVGRLGKLMVFGDDWDTPDGTGVRDYIHVMDLAEGHVAALRALLDAPGSFTLNLGAGVGHSVLDVVRAYEAASGRAVPYEIAPRRPGDVAKYWADPSAAAARLGWRTRRSLAQMCADSWRFQQASPHGYDGA